MKAVPKPNNDCKCCQKCGSPRHLSEDCDYRPNSCKIIGIAHKCEEQHYLTDEEYDRIGV